MDKGGGVVKAALRSKRLERQTYLEFEIDWGTARKGPQKLQNYVFVAFGKFEKYIFRERHVG